MTNDQREIHRKKRILEYAERVGNINKTCRYFGVARSTFYLWNAFAALTDQTEHTTVERDTKFYGTSYPSEERPT